MVEQVEGMLSPYRVLDLTDEKGLLCGKLLGDLGADVIKIERPGGDPARNIGPFYHDEPDPEKSLFWFAYNTSKRGITLNIETADGREIFKKLVKTADFVIESFPPGYMDKLELGYTTLEGLDPGIIMVSITPFGQTGPYKDYKAPGIVAWAMSVHMYPTGDGDRPPVQISHHPQAYFNAATEAAVGAMMALYQRQMTGEGQQVDVSIHEVLAHSAWGLISRWDMDRIIKVRGGESARLFMWPCKDDIVIFQLYSGMTAERRYSELVKWMDREGMAPDFLKELDWDTFNMRDPTTGGIVNRVTESIGKFLMTHTKAELFEAINLGINIYPVSNIKDIVESTQLAARQFWMDIEHSELGTTITYPGAFTKSSEAPPIISRRAPFIGEHNREVYESELGLTNEELMILKQANVI